MANNKDKNTRKETPAGKQKSERKIYESADKKDSPIGFSLNIEQHFAPPKDPVQKTTKPRDK